MLERIRKSKGFLTKAGALIDYVEWHVLVRGMVLPFLGIMFHELFGIGVVLWADAVLIPFALGLDVLDASNKWLKRLRKESQYFLYGHVPILIGYGLFQILDSHLVLQFVEVCI